MPVDILLGLQWGDEGKGKIVDLLTPEYDIVARFQGGPNAGHTLVIKGEKHVFHTLPSGVIHKDKVNVIGSGMVIDPITLKNEISRLDSSVGFNASNLLVSKNAHLILPTHRMIDSANEKRKGERKIGSTLKGIGPAYGDKMSRIGPRIGDLLTDDFKNKYENIRDQHLTHLKNIGGETQIENEREWLEAAEFIASLKICNTETYLIAAINEDKKILAEGAQGSLLDISFGTYPYVTSSHTIAAACCVGLGIPPRDIGKIYGVFKAYTTRVGEGPFPTELRDSVGEQIRENGFEFGSTTGRPRRCGWLDIEALNYAVKINGVSELIITKADVLQGLDNLQVGNAYRDDNGDLLEYPDLNYHYDLKVDHKKFKPWNEDIRKASSYSEFPEELKEYIQYIEEKAGVPVSIVSTGPDREETVKR